jgi:hypothetical protein
MVLTLDTPLSFDLLHEVSSSFVLFFISGHCGLQGWYIYYTTAALVFARWDKG